MIYFASDRNTATEDISLGFPILPSGTLDNLIFCCSSDKSSSSGHRIAPGEIALTLISGANSFARDLVMPSRADLAPEYRLKFFIPLGANVSEIFITQPFPFLKKGSNA